jgi:hypothetical protein
MMILDGCRIIGSRLFIASKSGARKRIVNVSLGWVERYPEEQGQKGLDFNNTRGIIAT